jgi:hypothetical protein
MGITSAATFNSLQLACQVDCGQSIFPDGIEFSVDQEVYATASPETGAKRSLPIGTVQAIGDLLFYTYRRTALGNGNRELLERPADNRVLVGFGPFLSLLARVRFEVGSLRFEQQFGLISQILATLDGFLAGQVEAWLGGQGAQHL